VTQTVWGERGVECIGEGTGGKLAVLKLQLLLLWV
jgi:hypothetical protein